MSTNWQNKLRGKLFVLVTVACWQPTDPGSKHPEHPHTPPHPPSGNDTKRKQTKAYKTESKGHGVASLSLNELVKDVTEPSLMHVKILFPQTVNSQFQLGGVVTGQTGRAAFVLLTTQCCVSKCSAEMLVTRGRSTVEHNFDM